MSSYYWDTSAIINASVSTEVWERLKKGTHVVRVHAFSEFFAILTGRGIAVRAPDGAAGRFSMSASEASAWLRRFNARVQATELDALETLDAFDKAEEKGVQGGRVYDYVHVAAAEKAKVDAVLTRNTDDFTGLSSRPVEWP